VGIDVILVHRLLKNSVEIPEYVLLTDELYGTVTTPLPASVGEITPELEGIGSVRAYFVDVADLDDVGVASPAPTLRSRLGSTFSAVGRGLPYMLGTRKPRRVR
jgi:hypothetical protein